MKKYLYAGALLGILVLVLIYVNKDIDRQINIERTKGLTNNEQTVEGEPLSDTYKAEQVSGTPLKLTQEEKEAYYKRYLEIVKEVNAEYNEDLEVIPFGEFAEEEWVEPEDFRQIAIDMTKPFRFFPYDSNDN